MGVKQIRETTKVMTRQMRDARSTVSSNIDVETAPVDTLQITGSGSNANVQSLCCVSDSPEEKLCCREDYELTRFGHLGGISKSLPPMEVMSETYVISDLPYLI
jgi:hypothetical protein